MTRFEEQLQRIRRLRKERDESDSRLYAAQLVRSKIEQLALRAGRKETTSPGKETRAAEERELHYHLDRLRTEDSNFKRDLTDRTFELQGAIGELYADAHPRRAVENLSDDLPFLLLPVRIETRFVTQGRANELWVRIYPDDIAIHSHESLLTETERGAGESYWKAIFETHKHGADRKEEQQQAAWSILASSFSPQRAAWIARQTKPVNWTPDLSGIPTADELQFPLHDQAKTHAWTRAPRTRVLPDKFVIMLYTGGALVREETGALIPDELIVGPDPLEAQESFKNQDGKLLFGGAFAWTSDFEAAVQIGMGFKIPLTAEQSVNGFDKILVLGLYLSADSSESRERLEELIDNHHYSPRGFSLVRQGTPTNNTEADASGYSANDPIHHTSYLLETGEPAFDADTDCDGRNLAHALGIEYTALQYILNSNAIDGRQAALMNRALYPATLGYFLGTLMQPVFGPASLDAIRRFYVDHVTGRGPLPAVRVGDQTYGVLLTSDFSRWKWTGKESPAGSAFLNALFAVLDYYQQVWNGLLERLMYVGKPGPDPDAILMNILGLQAGAASFHQRTGYSTDYLKNLDEFQYGGRYAADVQRNFTQKNTLLNFLHGFGYDLQDEAGQLRVPQALRLIYQHYSTLLDAANLVDQAPLSETIPVRFFDDVNRKNYLHWLAETTSIQALERQDFGAGRTAPNSLLYLQLRRALLLQLHKASADWFKGHAIDLDQTLAPANFQNIRPRGDLTKYEVMRAPVGTALPSDPHAAQPVSEYLLTSGQAEDAARDLVEMRQALGELASASTGQLERVFTEHLDACTYRLDAWQTGIFHLRLQEQRRAARAEHVKGIYLGAYGWLEHVRPGPRRTVPLDSVPEKLRPAGGQPLFEYDDNQGFVHAPSLNHASAAAVLRSGYMSHAGSQNPEVMAVNLASERVRRALFVLGGMRNGQSLEALLGYQFERGLHDRASADDALKKLNLYIYDFRDRFPYEQHLIPQQGGAGTPAGTLPLINLVNGVTLAEVTAGFPYGATGAVISASAAERAAVELEKDRLSDTLDAIKDLLLTESAYQMVQGNADRSGAVLNTLKEARLPPELDVIHTPRGSHLTFTNRVTLHFEPADPDLPETNPWSPILMSPRARLEPGINKWLGTVLGAPAELKLRAAHLDDNGSELGHLELSAADLFLQPIDLVYIAGGQLNTGASDASAEARTGASELEARIAFRYRQVSAVGDDTTVRIEFLQPANGKTLGQMLPLLRALKSLLTDSRPLHAQDFEPPSKAAPGGMENPQGYDAHELQNRIEAGSAMFGSALSQLGTIPIDAAVPDAQGGLHSYVDLAGAFAALDQVKLGLDEITFAFPPAHIPDLQAALTRLAGFGLTDAFPHLSSATTDLAVREMLEQAGSVLRRGQAALAQAAALSSEAGTATTVHLSVEKWIAAGKALFGEVFNFLPRFHYSNPADISGSDSDRPQLLKYAVETLHMAFPADEWLQSVSHVRPRSARWDYVRMLAESLGAGSLELRPVQLPYRAADSWLAVEFPAIDELTHEPFNILHDTLSVLAHGQAAFSASIHQCGLLIDDWTESVPGREQITGLAFNYDRPNASAPQAILLAVTPEVTGHWSWDDLVGILNDTLQRAKRRAVEPLLLDQMDLPQLGVLLPALVADFSQYDLNISLDYRLNLKSMLDAIPIIPAIDRTTG